MGYVVKNCPAVYRTGNAPLVCCDKSYRCDLVGKCLIKDIIEKCKSDSGPIRTWKEKGKCAVLKNGKIVMEECDTVVAEYSNDKYLADSILNMFEVEEVG